MARRKDKGAKGAQVTETVVVEERPGETHIHHTVREWHPHAQEKLPEIEDIIDSWGRRSTDAVPARDLDYEYVESQVDKLTRRVKGSRKVVVQETVTEWVERPVETVAAAPVRTVVVEDEDAEEEERGLQPDPELRETMRPARPKRRFLGFLNRSKTDKPAKPKKEKKAKKDKSKPADTSDPEYQPQCAALTEDGQQCRNSARGVSRYCSSHKGYQPPTAKGLAQRIEGGAWDPKDDLTDHQSVATADTRPVVRKAKDTRMKVRKVAKKSGKKAGRKKR